MLFAIRFFTCNRVCKRTAWILIRLRGCAGWSGSMLVANALCWFCRDVAHLSITAPDQQPPPSYEAINSTAVRLNWKGPDYPNGLITQYMLFRNGTLVYTLKGDGKAVAEYIR
jgi:hypothetical protein